MAGFSRTWCIKKFLRCTSNITSGQKMLCCTANISSNHSKNRTDFESRNVLSESLPNVVSGSEYLSEHSSTYISKTKKTTELQSNILKFKPRMNHARIGRVNNSQNTEASLFSQLKNPLEPHISQAAYLHCMATKQLYNKHLFGSHEVNFYQRKHLSGQSIVNASPPALQPYLRLIRMDKPIGTWLLYWPCTWSIGLAAAPGHLPDLWLLTLFGVGAFCMRGAGCIINDMWDRDFDKKVARTKLRPLASGELTMFNALVCLGGMLSLSLSILLQLNWFSVAVGSASMGLVILYPLAKRYTYFPQAMLGLTFNYGAILGWAAVQGHIDWSVVLPLYLSGFCWTMVYDTIYAHQDKYDDMLIGVKSTALKFGDQTKTWLTRFSGVTIGGLLLAGLMSGQTFPYYSAVGFTAGHLLSQVKKVDLNNADDCARKFKSNTWLGAVMFLGIVAGTFMKEKEPEKIKD